MTRVIYVASVPSTIVAHVLVFLVFRTLCVTFRHRHGHFIRTRVKVGFRLYFPGSRSNARGSMPLMVFWMIHVIHGRFTSVMFR